MAKQAVKRIKSKFWLVVVLIRISENDEKINRIAVKGFISTNAGRIRLKLSILKPQPISTVEAIRIIRNELNL